jgi:hypothetical protein
MRRGYGGSNDNCGGGCRGGKPLPASVALSFMGSSMVITRSYSSSCNRTTVRGMIEGMWRCEDRGGK